MKTHNVNNNFIYRSSQYSINKWALLYKGNFKENLVDFFNQPLPKESLMLSSYDVFELVDEYGKDYNRYNEKLIRTLIKYLSRMTFRCTPFGLFSGIDIGEFSETSITKRDVEMPIKRRVTKLDNDLGYALFTKFFMEIINLPSILFYPNTSLYLLGDSFRYIEYSYDSENKRRYLISQFQNTIFLKKILKFCEKGASKNEIISFINRFGANDLEANNVLTELLKNQILRTNIEPSICQINYPKFLLNFIESTGHETSFSNKLSEIVSKLETLDCQNIEFDKQTYKDIYIKMKVLGLESNISKSVQVDYIINHQSLTLSDTLKKNISEAISFTSFLPSKYSNPIHSFINAFVERFDNKAVDLAIALDPNFGVGYPVENFINGQGSLSPFLTKFNFSKANSNNNITWDWFDEILFNKYFKSIEEEKSIIFLDWNDLPQNTSPIIKFKQDTFSLKASIYKSEDNKYNSLIWLDAYGGSSAFPLITRFSYLDNKLYKMLTELSQFEQRNNPDKIIAEIVHIPEDRLGNVLQHSPLYKYEIPIITNPSNESEGTILIKDISIKVVNGKLILFSNKHKKEVIPRLCNAHSYSQSNIPVYKFLGDFQNYLVQPSSFTFRWPVVFRSSSFLPRVQFKNIVLSKAKWNVTINEINHLIKKFDKADFENWRLKRKVPPVVTISEGDNELLLNLLEDNNVLILLEELKKKGSIYMEECLICDINCPNPKDEYNNEYIFIFKRKN